MPEKPEKPDKYLPELTDADYVSMIRPNFSCGPRGQEGWTAPGCDLPEG